MNNSNEIKLINENGAEKTYGEIPDLWHIATAVAEGRDLGEFDQEQRDLWEKMILQVWHMAHDLKSVTEEQGEAGLVEVNGMDQHKREQLDEICRTMSGFSTFFGLVNAKGDYRPSIDLGIPEMKYLADEYDKFQEARGDDRRAYRFGGKS